jgi:CTD small phosphatase-like protein 2
LDKLDEENLISHRLYREHTQPKNNVYIKDLSLLGRDIKKCIIVDNNAENFQVHPKNGIFIKSWYGDQADQALTKLAPILKGSAALISEISTANCPDIRVALKRVKEAMLRNAQKPLDPLRD